MTGEKVEILLSGRDIVPEFFEPVEDEVITLRACGCTEVKAAASTGGPAKTEKTRNLLLDCSKAETAEPELSFN